MVFVVVGEVIVSAALDADQRDHTGVEFLECDTVPDGDQQVAGAMDNVGMTLYFLYPDIRPQMITQHPAQRQHR